MAAGLSAVLDKRTAGLALAALAIGLLLYSSMSRGWWTLTIKSEYESVTIKMGMTSSHVCIDNQCRVLPHKKIAVLLGQTDSQRLWLMAGAAAAWGAWVTAGFLFFTAFFALRRKPLPGVLIAQVTAVLSALLVLWAGLYVLLFPSEVAASVSMGHSPVTYFVGAVSGIAGSVLLAVGGEQSSTPSLDEVFD